MSRRVLFQGAFLLFVVVLSACSAPQKGPIHFGTSSQVSLANATQPHWEVRDGADPKNPNHIIGCSWIGNEIFIAQALPYVTFDGGKSWKPGPVTPVGYGDPDCGIASDGTAYFLVIPEGRLAVPPAQEHIPVWRSADGGSHWDPPIHIPFTLDRPWLTIDSRNNIFVSFYTPPTRTESMMGARTVSSRNGRSFTVAASYPQAEIQGLTGQASVTADGTYIWPVQLWKERRLQVLRLRGNRKLPIVKVADIVQPGGATSPLSAVDSSAGIYHDRVYIVWVEAESGKPRVLLAYSTDDGQTWSAPRTVSDDPRANGDTTGDTITTLAINKYGVVGITWYDRRSNPQSPGFNVRFTASIDGGNTFLPSVALPDARSTVWDGELQFLSRPAIADPHATKIPESGNGFALWTGDKFPNYGDTAGLTADANGTFHPMWIDNRTRIPQVWTIPVQVDATVVRNVDPRLARMQEITKQAAVQVLHGVLDTRTGLLTVQANLRNDSKQTLRGPFAIQVVDTQSSVAAAVPQNAGNQLNGPGAAWYFPPSIRRVRPGARTPPITLTFRLSDPNKTMQSGGQFLYEVLRVGTRVFGGTSPP